MTTSPVEVRRALAHRVTVTDEALVVELDDGRTLSVPVAWFPRLAHGSAAEQAHRRFNAQ